MAKVASFSRPCLFTSREVDEARGALMLAADRVRSANKK